MKQFLRLFLISLMLSALPSSVFAVNEWRQVGSSIIPEPGSIFWGNDISGDGQRIAIIAWTGNLSDSATIEAFDFLDGDWTKVGGTLTTDTGVGDIALSRDGQTLAIGESEYLNGGAGSVSVYHWNESEEDWQKRGASIEGIGCCTGFYGVSLSADGLVLGVSMWGAGKIRFYDFDPARNLWDMRPEFSATKLEGLSITDDGNRVVIGNRRYQGNFKEAEVKVYDWNGVSWLPIGQAIYNEIAGDDAGFVNISGDGNRLSVGSPTHGVDNTGQVRIYEYSASEGFWQRIGNLKGGPGEYLRNRDIANGLSSQGDRVLVKGGGNDAAETYNEGFAEVFEFDKETNQWTSAAGTINRNEIVEKCCDFAMDSSGTHVVTTSSPISGTTPADYNGETRVFKLVDNPDFGDADGVERVGGEFLVTSSSTNTKPRIPVIAPLKDGGFVISWSVSSSVGDALNYSAEAKRYGQDGIAFDNEFSSNYGSVSVAGLSDGGFVVARDSGGIFGTRYQKDNSVLGAEFQINTTTAGYKQYPAVTGLVDGGFVTTWQSNGQDGDYWGVYGQRFTQDSLRLSSEFQVNTTTAGGQHDSSVTSLSDGGFVVTWTAFIIDGNSSIYGQRYAADGSTVDTEFPVQTDTQTTGYQSAVAGLEDGGFVVTWMKQLELTYSDPGIDDNWDIYGRRFGEDGTALDAAFRINSSDPYTQEYPDIAALPDGGFVVVWQSFGQDESAQGIYGQVFSEFGDPVGTEFRVNTTTDSAQQRPSVAALADGGFVVTWESFEPSLEKFHVFGQRYKLTVGSSNLDIDGDGVPDNTDAFPDDPAASVDTDSDGKPDDWNEGKSEADSTSDPALVLDDDDEMMASRIISMNFH